MFREFAIKGYMLDKKRMKNRSFLVEDYFERLLEEIRDIWLSERRVYHKTTDIYATSVDYKVDYKKDAPTTKAFYAKVQNKLHFAVHGNTATELVMLRAESTKTNMGLTTLNLQVFDRYISTDYSGAQTPTTSLRTRANIISTF